MAAHQETKPVEASRFFFNENAFFKTVLYCVVYLIIAVICLVVGLMIGYAILGDGNPLDVLQWKTWQHILDFLK